MSRLRTRPRLKTHFYVFESISPRFHILKLLNLFVYTFLNVSTRSPSTVRASPPRRIPPPRSMDPTPSPPAPVPVRHRALPPVSLLPIPVFCLSPLHPHSNPRGARARRCLLSSAVGAAAARQARPPGLPGHPSGVGPARRRARGPRGRRGRGVAVRGAGEPGRVRDRAGLEAGAVCGLCGCCGSAHVRPRASARVRARWCAPAQCTRRGGTCAARLTK